MLIFREHGTFIRPHTVFTGLPHFRDSDTRADAIATNTEPAIFFGDGFHETVGGGF